jgi:hypothetical protein
MDPNPFSKLDTDPLSLKILDPEPHKLYADPKHWHACGLRTKWGTDIQKKLVPLVHLPMTGVGSVGRARVPEDDIVVRQFSANTSHTSAAPSADVCSILFISAVFEQYRYETNICGEPDAFDPQVSVLGK